MIAIPIGIVLDAIVAWTTVALLDVLTELISIISHALLLSPDMTGLPQVQALASRATWIVDSAYILTFTAAGVLTIVSRAADAVLTGAAADAAAVSEDGADIAGARRATDAVSRAAWPRRRFFGPPGCRLNIPLKSIHAPLDLTER